MSTPIPGTVRMLAAFLAIHLVWAGDAWPAAALGRGGEAVTGPASPAAGGLQIGPAVLAWDAVVAAGLPGQVAAGLDHGLVTTAGDILRGVPATLDQGTLLAESVVFGRLKLAVGAVSVIVLAPVALADLPDLAAGPAGAVLANGDRVAGTLAFLNVETVGIDTGKRIAQVPRGRVAAVVLGPIQIAPAAERAWVLLGSGDRIGADGVTAVPGGISVTQALGTAELPLTAIAAVWRTGGRITAMTSITPVRVSAADRIGAVLPAVPGRGFPAVIGGIGAADGLILPARGEAVWAVGGAASFACWIAAAPGRAGCSVRILADGKPVYERTCAAGGPPVAVRLPLAGVRELVLRSEPRPDGETASWSAAFCHPLVIK